MNPGLCNPVDDLGKPGQEAESIPPPMQVVAAGSMPAVALLDLQLSERVAAVVEYAAQNNVEPFLEPVLELSHAIMQREIAEIETAAAAADGGGGGASASMTGGGLTAVFLDQAVTFLELCTRVDSTVSRIAAACVLDLVRARSK